MASGSLTSQVRTGYNIKIDWNATPNQDGNYSDVSASFSLVTSSGYDLYSQVNNITAYINSKAVSLGNKYIANGGGSTTTLGSASVRVYHNSDGYGTGSFKLVLPVNATIRGVYVARFETDTLSVTLDKIQRGTDIPDGSLAGNRDITASHTIHFRANNSAYTHQLWYRLKTDNHTSGWIDLGKNHKSSVTFTPASSSSSLFSTIAKSTPNSATVLMDLCIRTFNGSTRVGDDRYNNNWYMKLNEDLVKPTFLLILKELNTNITFNKYVQNASVIEYKTIASAKYGASIKSIKYRLGNSTYTSNPVRLQPDKPGSFTVNVDVTDTRGITATQTKTIDVEAYAPPYFQKILAERCKSSGVLDNDGIRLAIVKDLRFTRLGGDNSVTMEVWWAESDSSSYTKLATEVYTSNSTYTEKYTGKKVFSRDKDYKIQIRYWDKLFKYTTDLILSGSYSLIDFFKTGKGIAFGQIATRNGFVVNMDAEFLKDVHFKETIYTPTLINGAQHYDDYDWKRLKVVKDSSGVVRISGSLKNTATSKPCFILPEECRPKQKMAFVVPTGNYTTACVYIEPAGGVNTKNTASNWVCLDTISFKV